ncbi:aminoglycoside 6-adenylyltransferase [Sphingobacterium haloxyli]|uniref:LinF n=1 Tax=Sphingobacterium haloxyli TaxID=2100533 RepID=A0A2S9J6W7_9SPHI|nr:aminoglycoside 6-adenylyltransferase [Sphingobacterium haloxyli]PRD48479.1 LinF [Sphingobacterium haloxyli]
MTQLQMIDATKSIARRDENVSAVLMYGSFTKNEGDQYSDIEFYIFLKSKENFSAEQWVNQISPTALYFTNEYGSEVAIFANLIRGEFHFLTVNDIEIIKSWEGFVSFSDFSEMNIIDKDGLLTKTLHQIKTISPDRTTNENILFLSRSLLNVLLITSNLIKRQEHAHAYQSLFNVQKYLLWLIRIATNQTNHWESPTKRLEKDIDQDWYSAFRLTTSDLDADNLRAAFQHASDLSKKLFDALSIPADLKRLLNQIGY